MFEQYGQVSFVKYLRDKGEQLWGETERPWGWDSAQLADLGPLVKYLGIAVGVTGLFGRDFWGPDHQHAARLSGVRFLPGSHIYTAPR